jgi:hypothetical protein
MRRRNLVVLLSAVTALGLPTVWAQEKLPVIGFLHQGPQPPATLMNHCRRAAGRSPADPYPLSRRFGLLL